MKYIGHKTKVSKTLIHGNLLTFRIVILSFSNCHIYEYFYFFSLIMKLSNMIFNCSNSPELWVGGYFVFLGMKWFLIRLIWLQIEFNWEVQCPWNSILNSYSFRRSVIWEHISYFISDMNCWTILALNFKEWVDLDHHGRENLLTFCPGFMILFWSSKFLLILYLNH
jgi:hypothetical protein